MMFVLLLTIGTIIVSAPIAAAVLVSVASRREDAACSLGGPPPGPACATARRIVDFHTRGMDWPRRGDRGQAPDSDRLPAHLAVRSFSAAEPTWSLPAAR
ncbi:MAG TPA: hypothetical protein VN840_05740 [Streptosporangiaceae bacterium]|nr:hypothetical protein [Streptosporangiaceae bacterium]